MNEYYAFCIKQEVADRYFHRSEILYQFIKDYQENNDRRELALQYDYITNGFTKTSLISHIKSYHQSNVNIHIKENNLEIFTNKHYMSLHIYKKHLIFCCETLHDAEELIFPTLRLFHPFLFIMGNELEKYGWISPIITSKQYKDEQVLYSHL